jgi:hypothetical protein
LIGIVAEQSFPLMLIVVIVWGVTIVADSAQFSASAVELSEPRLSGTSLNIHFFVIQIVPRGRGETNALSDPRQWLVHCIILTYCYYSHNIDYGIFFAILETRAKMTWDYFDILWFAFLSRSAGSRRVARRLRARKVPLDVTATGFAPEPGLKSLDGLHVTVEQIETPSATLTKTAPFAHQGRIAKQRRLDRKHIEPRHVTGRIAMLEHEILHGKFGHAPESQFPNRASN